MSFILGYLRMILCKVSAAIYLYGFLNQSLGLILGNIFFLLSLCAFNFSKFENNFFKFETKNVVLYM